MGTVHMTPLAAADIAAAAYTSGLPDLLAEIYGGSDYAQLRADTDGLHLAFCGSDDRLDWASNADAELRPYIAGRVHDGFLFAWQNMSEPIRRHLQPFAGHPIHLYGHSRGGAIAMLAALAIDTWPEHLATVETITTFGCPRPGDASFCRAVERVCPAITRYENRTLPITGMRDLVPHLPLAAQGYAHAGRAVYLRAYGRPSAQHAMTAYRAALR